MITIKVVSDLICPWCFIGKRRLEGALRQYPGGAEASVTWHPFQLNPDMPANGMDRKEYCTQKFGSWDRCQEMYDQIAEVGRTVGVEFRFDQQPTVPNTLDAHRVLWLAGKLDVQGEVMEEFFRAYFCGGIDLTDREELIEVAVAAGLERGRVDRMLSSGEGLSEVRREEREFKELGITAVPFFIIADRLAVSGAQPTETLIRALEQAMSPEPTSKSRKKAAAAVDPSCRL